MSNKNTAEIAEKHQQWIILALFLMAIKYVLSATIEVTGEQAEFYLEIGEIVLAVLAIGIIIPIFIWKFRNLSKHQRKNYLDPNGYIFKILKDAVSKSWLITLIFLVFIEIPIKKFLSHLPPRFFIQATLAVMFGSFSIIFFILDRRSKIDDSGEDFADV